MSRSPSRWTLRLLAIACGCCLFGLPAARLPAQEDPFLATPPAVAAPRGQDGGEAAGEPDATAYEATHQQAAIIPVFDDRSRAAELHTFCLSRDGKILAGVGSAPGEIRVFDADGQYLASWSVPVKPEAINVGPDGAIYVAGSGKLLKLDAQGTLQLTKPAPHAEQLKVDKEKLRAEVIQQAKQQAEAYKQYPAMFRQQIARLEEVIKAMDAKGDDRLSDEEKVRRGQLRQQIEMYGQALKQYEQLAQQSPAELSEEQIQQQVAQAIEHKIRFSSLSATDNDVFIACPAIEGYGFEVWRTDLSFDNPQRIITDLRGCCGQMDVQADEDGVFVAENSRHRVCRFDREGKMIVDWGGREREGIEGFGSCCNPMNLAFGPGREVYTAESTTGRIKRYGSDGQLKGLIGSVEIVPGCKKVSIAVSQDGSRVYMLDITRTHIVLMKKKPEPASHETAVK